ncbi:MAG: IS66 family insertion sequence element accessory protein TnpB [Phocaeicola sp.]
MYALTSSNKYYLYQGFIRMNLGMNGLYKLVRSQMSDLSPISGDSFIFFGKKRQSVKILKWDGDGFLLYYKKLEAGSFELPSLNPHTGNYELSYTTLSFILNGVSLKSVRLRKRFTL